MRVPLAPVPARSQGCSGGHREDLSADRLVRMMVGRDLSTFYTKQHADPARRRVLLSVRGVGDGHFVRDCSFDLHEGEVLGFAGLVAPGAPNWRG